MSDVAPSYDQLCELVRQQALNELIRIEPADYLSVPMKSRPASPEEKHFVIRGDDEVRFRRFMTWLNQNSRFATQFAFGMAFALHEWIFPSGVVQLVINVDQTSGLLVVHPKGGKAEVDPDADNEEE